LLCLGCSGLLYQGGYDGIHKRDNYHCFVRWLDLSGGSL